jgi:hypothetical protein
VHMRDETRAYKTPVEKLEKDNLGTEVQIKM